jgi:hypothetical protein
MAHLSFRQTVPLIAALPCGLKDCMKDTVLVCVRVVGWSSIRQLLNILIVFASVRKYGRIGAFALDVLG